MAQLGNIFEGAKLSYDEVMRLVKSVLRNAKYDLHYALSEFKEELREKYNIDIMDYEMETIFNKLVSDAFSSYGEINREELLRVLRDVSNIMGRVETINDFAGKVLEKGEGVLKEIFEKIIRIGVFDEIHYNIVRMELEEYYRDVMMMLEEYRKDEFLRKIITPLVLKVFTILGISVKELKGLVIEYGGKMILSSDRTVGITTIEEADKFIRKISERENVIYRECTMDAIREYEYFVVVPSGVKYAGVSRSIIRVMRPVIVYPDKLAPMMLKKISMNLAILIAPNE